MSPLEDGISSVQLINHMGDDLMVVNAARVSMDKESDYYLLDTEYGSSYVLSVADKKLLSYLAKHQHWTPFSHPQIQFRIKMPIAVARQWFKHQIGFTRNELSRRYVDTTPEIFSPDMWRKRADNVKQGSSDECFTHRNTLVSVTNLMEDAIKLYEQAISKGMCPEQARFFLPQAMYTEFIETGSLAAYSRLCKLRLDPHAQKEVRVYAEAVAEAIEGFFPESWKVLQEC